MQGARRIEPFARECERARVRRTDLGEHERRDDRRDEPEFGFGESEARVGRRDRDVADRDEPRSAAERRTVDPRDGGLGHAIDRAEHARERARVLTIRFRIEVERAAHPRDVGAAAERAPRAAQDDRADARIASEVDERGGEFGDEGRIEGVAHLGSMQRDARDVTVAVHAEADGVHPGGVRARLSAPLPDASGSP